MPRKKKTEALNKSNWDMEDIVKKVAEAQLITAEIPRLVREQIEKGGTDLSKNWKQLPNTDPKRSMKSWTLDPLSLQYSLGYKDRRFNLTYETLRQTVKQIAPLNAVINTRCAQVAAFSEPYSKTRSLGFQIKHKDPQHQTTPSELAFIKELEAFVLNCGRAEKNPYSQTSRDNFDTFLRKIVFDSLVMDQTCFEVVPDNYNLPFEFMAVDASTIRFSSETRYVGVDASYSSREGFIPAIPSRFAGLYEGRHYGDVTADGDPIKYIQLIYGQIENVYSEKELAFGVRNPRTNIYYYGYGESEVEQLITILTAYLHAELYNRNFFIQGSMPKGFLNFKGDNFTPEMLEGFKRQWYAQLQGTENSWRTPIFQSEGIEWIDLARSNQEMEFGKWMEFLIKIISGVFLIDPAEINFQLQGGVSQTPLFESSQEWKLKASRDRGLKPLLKFIAGLINKYIIDQIDDHFTFEFVGLDELSEMEKHELMVEQLASYKTLGEVRRTMDLPPIEGDDMIMSPIEGDDMIMSPTYLSALQLKRDLKQLELQEKQMQSQNSGNSQENGVESSNNNKLPGTAKEATTAPRYSDLFGLDNGN